MPRLEDLTSDSVDSFVRTPHEQLISYPSLFFPSSYVYYPVLARTFCVILADKPDPDYWLRQESAPGHVLVIAGEAMAVTSVQVAPASS